MASTEQPPKKRKPFEPPQPVAVPVSAEPEPPSPKTTANPPATTLSQEEIARKRRNQEEIRNFYESYKRLKYCIGQKDAHLMPELEQAYLSLITASRGCTSVQRLVAEFVPKYASYCPTALEAAAKVCINIHNWSMSIINRAEDADGFSFETARACIFGLATICQAASSETPTSSVIQGICSAVFLNVLSFFISSVEGQGIFQIVNKDVTKIYDSPKIFAELKQKFSDEEEAASVKLSKCRALCILWIFFTCPRNSLAACFELCSSNSTSAVSNGGQYFLNQVTARLDPCDVVYPLTGNSDGVKLIGSVESSSEVKDVTCDGKVSMDSNLPQDAYYGSKSCLLGLVLDKDPSLRPWIFSRVKSISKSASPNVVSDITSALERIFKSFTEQVKAEDKQVDSDGDDISPSKFIHRQFSVPRTSNQHRASEVSVREGSYPSDAVDQLSGLHPEHHGSITSETDLRSNTSSNNSGGPRSMDLDSVDHRELSRASSSTPRDLSNNLTPSAMPETSLDLGGNLLNGRNHSANTEIHSSRLENDVPALNASSSGVNSTFESPKHHLPSPYPSAGQPSWHFDGDRAAMDVYSASRHLWLGSLGPEASEAHVKFQFERFGPIDNFFCLPFKGFAVIEYKHIMDAIKAREIMRGRSPWGACLLIKFLDIGLGTRGDMNGVAVGSSCHVYVGNIQSQSDKDEILYELRKTLFKGPLAVNDLMSEGAFLMEFGTPEEAATVMAHLRQYRKEKKDFLQTSAVGPVNSMMPVDRSSHGSTSLHVDLRNNNLGNGTASSPHAQTVVGFSHCGKHNTNTMELTSPRINMVNQGAAMQSGYPFQSNWRSFGGQAMLDTGTRKGDTYDARMVMDPSQAGGHISSGAPEQNWTYRKPESVPHSTPGSMACISAPIHGHNFAPSQTMQASSFMRPVYYPPNSSWDGRGMIHHAPINPISSGGMHSNLHNSAVAPPFLPASVTPLAQIQGNPLPQHDQMFYVPPPLTTMPAPQPDLVPPLPPQLNMPPPLPQRNMPPPLPPQLNMPPPLPPHPSLPPPLPMHPELLPPLPPSPPPLLESQPPPPPPPIESLMLGSGGYWQGALSKSGVHYSTVHARKLHSDACNYTDNISEPAEWPTKLDITKRTDFRHVMSTFSSTPPHKEKHSSIHLISLFMLTLFCERSMSAVPNFCW
ncbi:uncharacterized protein LOC112511179 isoform X3 [Cynara cardunculus var. scolymus]|uniref:uncharacterized protein LOC112511179 isoform X3 n=1 Tax=Cynara cardunculus var. scolymus TaxID=59895 RepID=UPI000D623EAB|nr:uncharacterized protein LOC112511179 isoform X3 [Cynara cardunculus var. scolymus]